MVAVTAGPVPPMIERTRNDVGITAEAETLAVAVIPGYRLSWVKLAVVNAAELSSVDHVALASSKPSMTTVSVGVVPAMVAMLMPTSTPRAILSICVAPVAPAAAAVCVSCTPRFCF